MGLYITFAVLLLVIVCFIMGKWPFGLISMLAAAILNVTGVLKFSEAFANFANPNVIMVGGMFVLSAALGKTSLVDNIKDWGMKKAGNSSRMLLFSFLLTTILLTQFLPPTGLITMMIPFTLALASDGPLPKSRVIYPISAISFLWQSVFPYISGIGQIGMLNGYLTAGGSKLTLRLYDRFLIGIVPAILTLIFMLVIGYKLLPTRSNKAIDETAAASSAPAMSKNVTAIAKNKEYMIYGIFILTIVGMIFSSQLKIDMGVIPVIGVILLMITKCMGQKDVVGSLNMDVIFMLVGVMSLSTALDKSGAGKVIADGIIAILGGSPSPAFIMAVFFFVPCIMTQFMSNSACQALMEPLAIMTAIRMGYDPRGIAMLTALAANASVLTPMASPSMAIAFGAGGYTLKDYIKIGLPLMLIYGIAAIISALFVYPPI